MGQADLDPIAGAVRPVLDERFAARERGLTDSRKAIRAAANTIRHLHRGEFTEARSLVAESGRLLQSAQSALGGHPDVLHAGFVNDAAKEYAEARLVLAVFEGAPLPTHQELGIDAVPFLHGLGETVGECRRRLLDSLRAGNIEDAEALLAVMDDVVDLLAALDYPDGMTAGLRRTTDVARALAERSRSDLTATVVQERLRADLAKRLDI